MKGFFISVFSLFALCSCANGGGNAHCPHLKECDKSGKSHDDGFCANAEEKKMCNDVVKTILSRRSIRRYKSQPVGRDTLQTIIECGINAPSGLNRQTWELRAVDDKAFIDSLTAIYRRHDARAASDAAMKNMFRNAPTVVFVAKTGKGEIDCALLGENMALAAWSMGIGSCFLGGSSRFLKSNEEAKPYIEKLGFSDGAEIVYCLALGYPDETPDAKPRDAAKARIVDIK